MTWEKALLALAAVVRLDAEHLRALLPRFLRANATLEGGAEGRAESHRWVVRTKRR